MERRPAQGFSKGVLRARGETQKGTATVCCGAAQTFTRDSSFRAGTDFFGPLCCSIPKHLKTTRLNEERVR